MRSFSPCACAGLILSLFLCLPTSATAQPFDRDLFQRLASAAPQLNRDVLNKALEASRCAVSSGIAMPKRLAVIDFSLPSNRKRMWIFDLSSASLLIKDLVAHGRASGSTRSTEFSNREGSHKSSIGLFRASETYYGKHGYSLRLDGLEPGINDQARERAIVIHGADYVSPKWVNRYGRIGRSLGCPAVDNRIIEEVVDDLKGGQLVFKYYPDQKWLQSSSFLHCDDSRMAASGGGQGGNS
ncbi:murein L,D-transpeptidase catalytic domain family protein [Marinobacter sp. C2H3]|uniref:murein L,D-transpeptidase catalytic domain family protein n=1 Tax=Marinobacter sp. C2H3 TaxID=3119003 RepID=UPI00300F36D9